jgi:two-component system phosphate regulon response regulator PhoB
MTSPGWLGSYSDVHTLREDSISTHLKHPPTEFRILCLLSGRPGWVFSRQQILETTSGYEVSATERSVDVHIASLRRKLGYYGDTIETIRGVGYRFSEALEHEQPV